MTKSNIVLHHDRGRDRSRRTGYPGARRAADNDRFLQTKPSALNRNRWCRSSAFGGSKTTAGKKVLAVDGRQWKEGQSSAGIADKARALYGERYAEFLDRVQVYAYFPYVVAPKVENFTDGEITVRFEGLSGRIDQGAGILFNLNRMVITSQFAPTASKTISCSGNSRTASAPRSNGCGTHRQRRRQWHELKVRISGTKVEGYLRWQALSGAHARRSRSRAASACGRRPTAICTSPTIR